MLWTHKEVGFFHHRAGEGGSGQGKALATTRTPGKLTNRVTCQHSSPRSSLTQSYCRSLLAIAPNYHRPGIEQLLSSICGVPRARDRI
jgi:hypothetical protein